MQAAVSCPLGCGEILTPTTIPAASTGPSEAQEFACGARYYDCRNCARYIMSLRDEGILTMPDDHLAPTARAKRRRLLANGARLRALLFESRSRDLPSPWLRLRSGPYWPLAANPLEPVGAFAPVQVDEFLDRWPRTISDRLDRALLNLGRLSPTLGTSIDLVDRTREPVLFSTTDDEAFYMVGALQEIGWVKADCTMGWQARVELTPRGWERVAEIESGSSRSARDPVFVAMWFGDDATSETCSYMTTLFNDHIRSAVGLAGYRGERVDTSPDNDFVMDRILGMIRVAPFVVADFTGNRGGVYFEAGFARGLGTPVIHTCRDAHFEDAHFDIKQINTIVWTSPEDLAEKLYYRIIGTLGRGPSDAE